MRINEEMLIAAIAYKRCMAVNYRFFSRVIEPYALGTDTHGKRVLLVYQVSGGDENGDALGWKLFTLDELGGASILGDCTRIEGREPPVALLDEIGDPALSPRSSAPGTAPAGRPSSASNNRSRESRS